MSLEPAAEPDSLYLAVGEEVNKARPIFTGDIFREVELAGVGTTPAIVIAHPCSIRGRDGALQEQILVAAVSTHQPEPAAKWSNGFYDRVPLPGLPLERGFHVARLAVLGLVQAGDLMSADRIACLSESGINQLQQRLVFHLARLEVATAKFQEAFGHTYEEAELLENWSTDLAEIEDAPAASFEAWIREGSPSRQMRLLDYAQRAAVRRELREEVSNRLQAG